MKTMFTRFCGQILSWLMLIFTTYSFASTGINLNKTNNIAKLQQLVKSSESKTRIPFIKRKSFLTKTDLLMVQLSPNGEYLSYIQRLQPETKKRFAVWLYDIDKNKHVKLFTFKNINHLSWTSNSKALLIEADRGISFAELNNVDCCNNTSPELITKIDPKRYEVYYGPDQYNSEYFYVKHKSKQNKSFELHRYNLSGQSQLLYENQENFDDFLVNAQGELTLLKVNDGDIAGTGKITLFNVANNQKKAIWQCKYDDPCEPYLFNEKFQILHLRSNVKSDKSQLVKVNLKTSEITLLHEDEYKQVDLESAVYVFNDNKLKPILTNYYHATNTIRAIDQTTKTHLNNITEYVNHDNFKVKLAKAKSPHLSPWLIEQQNSNQSHATFSLYHPDNQTFTSPFNNSSAFTAPKNGVLNSVELPEKHAISYQASDGMIIHAYLTLPAGVNIKNAPLVALIHGGPWSRDKGTYDRRVQFLVNRGYIVFQPNFRGSTGFGRHYMNSAKGTFGDGRVQQDITDGVLYLITNEIGSKESIAIVGHSFGGFSALAGLSFTPELYQVGFAAAPPTDLSQSIAKYSTFEKHRRKSSSRAYFMKEQVVDWRNDKERQELRNKSPDLNTNKVIKPLFIWAGANDKRVLVEDVKDYATRVEEHNKSVTLLVDKKSGHGPRTGLSQEAYFYGLEYTLSRYLGGSHQTLDEYLDRRLIKFLRKNTLINKGGVGL